MDEMENGMNSEKLVRIAIGLEAVATKMVYDHYLKTGEKSLKFPVLNILEGLANIGSIGIMNEIINDEDLLITLVFPDEKKDSSVTEKNETCSTCEEDCAKDLKEDHSILKKIAGNPNQLVVDLMNNMMKKDIPCLICGSPAVFDIVKDTIVLACSGCPAVTPLPQPKTL